MQLTLSFLTVGCGGFVGSMLRYALSLLGQRVSGTFPHGTLWANLGGCLFLGLVAAFASATNVLSPNQRLLLASGLCGGFTTMSTFTHETFQFLQGAQYLHAAGYFLVTVIGCTLFFAVGYFGVLHLSR
ncbi:MAG: fluoride efflux transporter CrcB [Kiritimatiellia bacterium]|jgi:CrcB protein|nr:fluoride efflux transporter CrcB [Kiritimatiellia bacterium]MDD4173285.1 fluoride efflux transporter CrcB [Kiritimatiellia bacterium]MDD4440327.1 fluoride efflux transporter CrcB [Kiritimatiellia bacterium]MDX9792334.1 fluoride efflux transporter CrcB [Kiritimatiellia bacterium]NLC80946.1 fluoride efflux transporter CrcB [Lentisphaerota bacterium]